MAKRIDPLKAKQAKQKKIAIGLGLVFVLVLAYQGPKTLKMLKGPSPAAAPAAAPAPTTPVTPAAPGTPAPAVAVPTPAGVSPTQPAVLADTDTPITASAGQLLSFERFTSSDPFRQQAEVAPTAAPAEAADPAKDGAAKSDPAPVEKPVAPKPKPADTDVVSIEREPVPPAADTTISVNGVVQIVIETEPFPAEDPTFELVSLGNDGKSVQIGVAGGSISGGAETVKLVLGKPLTLQNTANGSRYELVLLTVKGAVPPRG